MANPQKENGYTSISNEITEALCRCSLGHTENQLLWAILRKTYGWHKKEDPISIGQLVEMTRKSRRMVIYALQNLEAKRMITIKRQRGRGIKNEINKISFQKNYELWVVQEKSDQYGKSLNKRKELYQKSKLEVVQEIEGSARNGKKVVQETVNDGQFLAPTKETITKETITKEIFSSETDEMKLSQLLFSLIQKRNPKFITPNLQQWASHINKLIRINKRTPNEISEVIEWSQQDDFWQNNILSTQKLRKQFDTLWLKSRAGKKNLHAEILEVGERWLAQTDQIF